MGSLGVLGLDGIGGTFGFIYINLTEYVWVGLWDWMLGLGYSIVDDWAFVLLDQSMFQLLVKIKDYLCKLSNSKG